MYNASYQSKQSKIELVSLILEIFGSVPRRLKILLNFIHSIHVRVDDSSDECLSILLNILTNSSIGKSDINSPNDEKYTIENIANFYVCFFSALKASKESQRIFGEFISKIINDQDNLKILLDNSNQCYLFLMILYYVIVDNSISDLISKLISTKIEFYQCSLQCIHVLEKACKTSLYHFADKLIISLYN